MIFVLLRLLAGLVRSRLSLVAENEMLRQQLVAAKCRLQGKRVRFSTTQRWLIGHMAITAMAWRTAVAPGPTGHGPAVAPRGLSPLLALALEGGRAEAEQSRPSHSRDGRSQSAMGSRANSRGAPQTGNPPLEAHGAAAHAPTPPPVPARTGP